MRHNSIDETERHEIKENLRVRVGEKRMLGIVLLLGFGMVSCSQEYQNSQILEVQIQGNHWIQRQEILNAIGWKPGVFYHSQTLLDWDKKLKENPRIQSLKWKYRYGKLEIIVQEREPVGLLHTQGDIYEFDENFFVLSKNDVRATWIPILSGDFPGILKSSYPMSENLSIDSKLGIERKLEVSQSPLFRSLWKQSVLVREKFPLIWQRISEIQLNQDGDIFLYFHEPTRFVANMGNFLSTKQLRKLYSSVAYFEKEAIRVHYLDLTGEDGFYY